MTEETRRTEPIDQPQTPEAASANESTANANEEKTDVMPSLEEMLRIAEQKAAEHHDAWLRAKAEAENVRRRAQEEVAKASKFASERFAASMLPVKDSLEAALGTPNQTLETLRQDLTPVIAAASTLLVALTVLLMIAAALIRKGKTQ